VPVISDQQLAECLSSSASETAGNWANNSDTRMPFSKEVS
jgi:hypothetical protein